MKFYAIMIEDINTQFKALSKEAFTTLEQAQSFCIEKGAEKINELTYVSRAANTGYVITELSVK